ncbi:MAG: T9SS type A sorting domain-containing protein, partial [Algoriphagus sp.]|uniref:T9SS type A sorting domain-containing protein n=1 Tax=Algoriphagus sp. TaxID=1872435 RepID=UPI0027341424
GGGAGPNGTVNISYSCPDANKFDCIEIIDDGAISGTTVIRFICDDIWDIPEGLVEFSVHAVGGGGGGGRGFTGGGGGGGGFASTTVTSTSAFGIAAGNSLNIKVGGGGLGSTNVNIKGGNGGSSSVTSTIPDPGGNIIVNLNALGGGGGGSFNNLNGNNGASGGGGAYGTTPTNTPGFGGSGTPGQGRNGGNGGKGNGDGHARAGGGGGGASQVGEDGSGSGVGLSQPGDGGNGSTFVLAGSTYGYGAGGGGIGYNFNGNTNSPGLGGSANGVRIGGTASDNGVGNNGTIYTGSGGGAGTTGGGNGGQGVVYVTFFNFRILGVEYLYFNAKHDPQSRSGQLSWATSREWENSHFEIERAVNDVRTWTKVGEVQGAGYSDTTVDYEFTDTELPATGGNIFYRLKQVDMKGDFSYSLTRSIQVNPIKGNTAWIGYPNPSDLKAPVTVAMIDNTGYTDGTIQVRISDIRGIFSSYSVSSPDAVSNVVNSHLENARPGMYIIQLIWGSQSEQLKLIKK